MQWLLIIAGVFAVLLLAIVLIGLMPPKSHRATRSARFRQSPEAVFAAISGSQNWRPGVKCEVVPTDGGPRRWREQSGHHSILFEEVDSQPPHLFRSRIADPNLPFGGTWTWEITPTRDGCIVRITEDGEVRNPIFRFVGQLITGYTATIDGYLSAMGTHFTETIALEP